MQHLQGLERRSHGPCCCLVSVTLHHCSVGLLQERVGQTEKEKSQLLMQQALITQFMQNGAPGVLSPASICLSE